MTTRRASEAFRRQLLQRTRPATPSDAPSPSRTTRKLDTGPTPQGMRKRLDRAFETLKHERAGLTIYADDERKRRETELLDAFLAVVCEAEEMIRQGRAQVEQEQRWLASYDPLHAFSDDDLQRAESLREFVREDAERLPMTALADRLTMAQEADDPVVLALLARYARQRLDQANAAADAAYAAGAASGSRPDVRGLAELSVAVEAI